MPTKENAGQEKEERRESAEADEGLYGPSLC